MLLDARNAVIYGGGGAIGGAVARAFAAAGARVHLAGRTKATLEVVAEDIRAGGGSAETAVVDALDEAAVDAYVDEVARTHGSVDVSFNLVSVGDVQGKPLVDMTQEDYVRPIDIAVRSTFITGRAAGRQMIRQGSGVILMFGGDDQDAVRDYSIGGFQVALVAVEAMRRQLAAELGRHGIRVLSLHTGGVLETVPRDFEAYEQIAQSIVAPTMLGRAATLDDIGNVAVFAASDLAASMTGTALNITCGAYVD
jgi:3-oxoacyl-[acyl-carrier protein] reductase